MKLPPAPRRASRTATAREKHREDGALGALVDRLLDEPIDHPLLRPAHLVPDHHDQMLRLTQVVACRGVVVGCVTFGEHGDAEQVQAIQELARR